jgi:hypothetical protein
MAMSTVHNGGGDGGSGNNDKDGNSFLVSPIVFVFQVYR